VSKNRQSSEFHRELAIQVRTPFVRIGLKNRSKRSASLYPHPFVAARAGKARLVPHGTNTIPATTSNSTLEGELPGKSDFFIVFAVIELGKGRSSPLTIVTTYAN
jgi:hypothetical protein